MLFVLGVLIFVHELGHFVMARRVGVSVLKFSLGFGPRLVGFKRGDTEYVISAIPLGGYVKMAGENPDDPRSGRDDEFLSKTKWQRFQILIMGPLMNLILAVVVTAGVLMNGAEIPAFQSKPPVVGQVTPDSPAASAGIQRGDRIVTRRRARRRHVGAVLHRRRHARGPRDRDRRAARRQGVRRQGDARAADAVRNRRHRRASRYASARRRAAARRARPRRRGLKAGDVILRVDGATITLREPADRGRVEEGEHAGDDDVVARTGAEQDVTVTPEANTGRCPSLPQGDGCIGISIGEDVTRINPGPIDAIGMSIKRNYESAGLIFMTIGQLITRETSTRQLMGPLAIAQLSGESAQQGWVPLFALMASISLNLGLLNLLPIPVLDGGHIFIMALEGLARRDFSLKVKEKMFLAGFAVLLMLMVTVIYNDLTRIPLVERLMPWRQTDA